MCVLAFIESKQRWLANLALKGLEWLVVDTDSAVMPIGAGYQQVSYSGEMGTDRKG